MDVFGPGGGLWPLEMSAVSDITGSWDWDDKRKEGGFEFSFQSGKKKIKPCVYKELLVDPSGKDMKETLRHFFKIYFYWTINEYNRIKASPCLFLCVSFNRFAARERMNFQACSNIFYRLFKLFLYKSTVAQCSLDFNFAHIRCSSVWGCFQRFH